MGGCPAREALVSKMDKGDKVILSGGMHGTISAIEDTTILVQVSDTTKIRHYGFHELVDTAAMFRRCFEQFRVERLIP